MSLIIIFPAQCIKRVFSLIAKRIVSYEFINVNRVQTAPAPSIMPNRIILGLACLKITNHEKPNNPANLE